MNGINDLAAMQQAAERRVYEMQRRSDAAVHGSHANKTPPCDEPYANDHRKSLFTSIPEPDRLLRDIPDEYLLLAVLLLLIKEKCSIRLILAIAYLLL